MIEFDLPKELIAQSPANPRDHARLLVYERSTKRITDDHFYNLLKYVPSNSLVVANNSKVEHCRLLFSGGKREVFVLETVNNNTVRALVRPGKLFKLGAEVQLTDAVSAVVTDVASDGIRTLRFSSNVDHPELVAASHVPLPPYIAQNDELAHEYQTLYAKDLGSKAAPTAGLHFTDTLLNELKRTHGWAEVTLHVGLGTFAPLTQAQLTSGTLHAESYEISDNATRQIQQAAHVTAVGTTTTRTIESAYRTTPLTRAGSTDIFIQPGYEFGRVNSLVTNFHLPGTSLLLMIEAFVGSESETMRMYEHAIQNKYRFYSFGDAMLIL